MNSREKDEERKFELIWKKNWMLLAEFNDWMLGRGLSKRTSHMHLSNVTMYMQEYLMYDGPLPPANGTIGIGMYLGSWFIRKAPYASPGTVRSNATTWPLTASPLNVATWVATGMPCFSRDTTIVSPIRPVAGEGIILAFTTDLVSS